MPRIPIFLLLALGLTVACGDKDDTGAPPGTQPSTDDTGPGATTQQDDQDGDGFLAEVDCDDEDAATHPGADEVCDGADNDCDGLVDDDDPDLADGETYHADDDQDGYGDPLDTRQACELPDGYTSDASDCDDGAADVHPGADEPCDGVDNNCDGVVDEGDGDTWYADADGDGYGDVTSALLACVQPEGYVAVTGTADTDCDDADASVYPGAEEICDEVDNDCDGEIDGDDATGAGSWYADSDGDGFGDPAVNEYACDQPTAYVADDTDCDDADARVFPGAVDLPYDGVDSDCDGASDYDVDADGYDSDAYGGDDCDDDDVAINPGASETFYDGVDSDCDGASDYDADGDGYDSDAHEGSDCDDGDASVYPGATESDPAVDEDCDGEIEAAPTASAAYVPLSSLEHCSALILDASASVDPDGFPLSYDWTVDSAPSSSSLTTDDFDDATAEQPVVHPDTPGVYVFGLTITDVGGLTDSSSVSVTITARATNTAPVADAGSDVTVTTTATCSEGSGYEYLCDDCLYEGSPVDAAGSTDVDGEPLSYAWIVASGMGTIDDDTLASPLLTLTGSAAEYGSAVSDVYLLEVDVTDCYGYLDTASVWVTVECTGE